MLPAHAPPEFQDRSTLWNSVEEIEKSSDAQLAREIEVALPVELSRAEQLALVRAFVKDNFVAEGKQSDYINSLKQRVNQSEQYADHLRDGRYAEELKVQEANKRIFELQRTNQQLERLVKLIPPEVLAELQKSGGDRPRGR